jgi:type II secretory pathway pseudopilin PulG
MNIHHSESMTTNSKPAKEKGFTFIETLVSVTILLFAIAGVMTMTTISIKTNFNQINNTKAVKLAEEAIERKLREDFDTLSGETFSQGELENFPTFTRTVTINTIDLDNKTITAYVTWKARESSGSPPITLTVMRTR